MFTRRAPGETGAAVRRLAELAAESGITLRVPEEEVAKHGLSDLPGAEMGADPDGPTDLAVVMGGDGTILTAMRRYAGREVPVFAINFGAIGFLATVERDGLDDAIERALTGQFEVLRLPALAVGTSSGEHLAVNDISFHRRQDLRVAELGYSVVGAELGEVRCDGLVVATPAGLHRLQPRQRRAGDGLGRAGLRGVLHRAAHAHRAGAGGGARRRAAGGQPAPTEEPVDVTTDGRPVCTLDPQERVEVRFRDGMALLAQVGGASFYNRLRDKFGRLSY